MPLAIRDISVTPPERWHFPVAGIMTVEAPNFNALLDAIDACCKTNGAGTPSNQEVIDYLCSHTHIPCYDTQTRVPLVNAFSLSLPVPQRSCCSKAK